MELLKRALLVGIFFSLIFSSSATAQDIEPTDDEVNAIAKNMYCPVCENIPLDQCGTVACQQWRDEIRDKLRQGWTEDEIYDYFVEKFGDRVLALPPRRGLNWLIYILPPVIIVLGGVFVFRTIRDWRAPVIEKVGEDESEKESKDKYEAMFEEELKKRL